MKVSGVVRPPGDKSISHRALMMAAMSQGGSEILGLLPSLDVRSTARGLRALGVHISRIRSGRRVRVEGSRWTSPRERLHCGNSGTTARLLLGATAGKALSCVITGDPSLRRRPMRRVTEPLRLMGAEFREPRSDGLPVEVCGAKLHALTYTSPVASAQVKGALLLAGLTAGVGVTLTEPTRSRDHTERLLRHLGVPLEVRHTTVTLPESAAPNGLPGFTLSVPGDLSSAAFLIAAALLADGGELVVRGVGVNPTRTGMLDALARMGADIEIAAAEVRAGEPVADLLVRPGPLGSVEVGAADVPRLVDEIPMLAILASRAEGVSRFEGVGELRFKESDRLELLSRNLRAVGVAAHAEGDCLEVRGGSGIPRGVVETEGDHRMAMAFTILGLLPGAQIRLSEHQSPDVSFPNFHSMLAEIVR
ncbi:MAG TPA: 3-phosphoshikimate 1-carboxyvinyltransferase [Gemmatimonadales bacterium]|jgi:3-phosphoshikimate 1-carboxyvinyltransferase